MVSQDKEVDQNIIKLEQMLYNWENGKGKRNVKEEMTLDDFSEISALLKALLPRYYEYYEKENNKLKKRIEEKEYDDLQREYQYIDEHVLSYCIRKNKENMEVMAGRKFLEAYKNFLVQLNFSQSYINDFFQPIMKLEQVYQVGYKLVVGGLISHMYALLADLNWDIMEEGEEYLRKNILDENHVGDYLKSIMAICEQEECEEVEFPTFERFIEHVKRM